jgi:hypothetical protein
MFDCNFNDHLLSTWGNGLDLFRTTEIRKHDDYDDNCQQNRYRRQCDLRSENERSRPFSLFRRPLPKPSGPSGKARTFGKPILHRIQLFPERPALRASGSVPVCKKSTEWTTGLAGG